MTDRTTPRFDDPLLLQTRADLVKFIQSYEPGEVLLREFLAVASDLPEDDVIRRTIESRPRGDAGAGWWDVTMRFLRIALASAGAAPPEKNQTTADVVAARRTTHGDFKFNTAYMQAAKVLMRAQPNWAGLATWQQEALDMIQHKIGRVLHGDPDYDDHWVDVAGYAERVVEILRGKS